MYDNILVNNAVCKKALKLKERVKIMKKPIRLGMIGVGRAGYSMHLSELKGKEDMYQIVAVCDREADRRDKMHEQFGCRTYSNVEDIVMDPDIDVIDIATRSNDHYTHAKTALDAGKIVFLEKPISETYEEAKQLVELAKKYGANGERRLYVRHNRRFEAQFMQVNKIIESGILGDVYYIKRSEGSFSYRRDWQTLSQYGGGQLLNWGPHLVDQSLRFAGGDYKRMMSVICQVNAAGDCEDVVRATMVGVNGRTVEMVISGADAITPPSYIVCGNRGSLYDINGEKFKIKYLDPEYKRPDFVANIATPTDTNFSSSGPLPFIEEEREWDKNPLDHTWIYLYEAVREGKEYPISNEEALKVMQTIQHIKDQNKEQ